ncbi:Calcium-dependent lipid-binding (CaLB domain) family protein [Striga hermonthica]|uniref:Calcium-dependent lipid-binding (CaLB domain) family protein n=1 Tax=Striga hermonthica TaxID=68872 RepID=A0A9N7MZT7_STRHE|nr:Calcium-dependent lipid-binding (CaLB domain) family protein [Striga hermonthica]
MAPRGSKPFQLLEMNIISGQDLEPAFRKMKTYARAWVNPARKLSSCIDSNGNNNPTWNDKFVFRVDDEFLREDTSAVVIEIYATHWLRDVLVGTVRVLVANLIPPPVLTRGRNGNHIGMRFVALQVRRPSGRPQGILNIGVALLDGSMRSMPLYSQLSASAVGFRDLMQNPPNHQKKESKKNNDDGNNNNNNNNVKPILLRTRSEKSERVTFDNYSPNSSIVAIPLKSKNKNKRGAPKESSILSISDVHPLPKKGKSSSVISGAEQKPKGGKPSSVVSDSKVSSRLYKKGEGAKGNSVSVWSDSEVGPSPSEVAAMIARYPLKNENGSSVLDGWSADESVEGLRSKLERWRMEVPPLYDNNGYGYSSRSSSHYGGGRRRGSEGSGLFSCFGNICGYECQCVCGTRSQGYMASSLGSRSYI